jgi:tRNA(Ile)-lysidine synthase
VIDPFYLDDLPESPQPDEAWLDAEVVSAGLTVRNMQPGDRFQPLGMEKGTTKVSDLFTNEKVPQRIRRLWPLVFSGERLAWITGCRTAEFGRVTSDSKRVVYLRLMKPN